MNRVLQKALEKTTTTLVSGIFRKIRSKKLLFSKKLENVGKKNLEIFEKSALASGVRPCSGTHTPGSALRAGATRRSPTQCVVAIEGASLRSALYTATREWFARRILFLRSKCWCYLNSSTRSKAMFVLRVGTIQVSLDNRLFQV